MTVGERIKQIRKDKGLTQDELAQKLGISRAAMGQFEKESSHPRAGTLQKIADALGVPVYEFSLNEGERIKMIRESRGLSQKELGDKTGLTSTQIAQIEDLSLRPSNHLIFRLATALNVQYSALVTGSISDESLEMNDDTLEDEAVSGLKAMIKKLYGCEDATSEHFSDVNRVSGLHFIKDNRLYVISENDINDLMPLVEGLIHAYVEQKKVAE